MNKKIQKRIKSLLWRAGGMSFVAVCVYIAQIGDVFTLDYKNLTNIAVLAFLGLVVGEITKLLNNETNQA